MPLLETVSGERFATADEQASLLKDVVECALADPANLDMGNWHSCDTTHCLSGWAIHRKGKEGYDLEKKVGPATAGALLLGLDAASMFFLPTDEARGRLEMIRQGVAG